MKKTRRDWKKGRKAETEIYRLKRQNESRSYTRERVYEIYPDDLRNILRGILHKRELDLAQYRNWLGEFFDEIAGIIGKTYVERGDGAQLADDVALLMVREILLEIDAGIIERHRDRPMPERALRWLDPRPYRRLRGISIRKEVEV
jgi:hypothetical protein